MILAFYNIAIFDKYFGVFGSDLGARTPVRLTIKCPPRIKPLNFFAETE